MIAAASAANGRKVMAFEPGGHIRTNAYNTVEVLKHGEVITMEELDWVVFDKGRARFCGAKRDTEVGAREVLAVQLEHGLPRYGEFSRQEVDHTHYNVEILSFGYGDKLDVGLKAPPARVAFSYTEIDEIRSLIVALMFADRKKPPPMRDSENFLGQVFFREGWIREKNDRLFAVAAHMGRRGEHA